MTQQSNIAYKHKTTLRGVVVPEQWDDNFHVTEVHIACKGEREIRIENLDSFPDLLTLSQTEALFTGTVRRRGSSESIIIESFTTLNEE